MTDLLYDDAAWHYDGDFPDGLPAAAGATHIGMFLAWMLLNGHGGARHAGADEPLRRRSATPGAWFLANCAERLTDADLSDEGNRFAQAYYLFDEDRADDGEPSFLPDYAKSFPDAAFAYSVADDWATYDRLAPILAHRFAMWRGMTSFAGADHGL
jgi:hypothetical protein